MRTARGFSLIEVLVAFGLLAGGLGLLIAILSAGMQQVRWAQAHSEAVQVARSALDTMGRLEPLQPGRTSGEVLQGRYSWVLDIEPWEDDMQPAAFGELQDAVRTAALYRIDLELRWGDEGPRERLRMSTLRSVRTDLVDEGGWTP